MKVIKATKTTLLSLALLASVGSIQATALAITNPGFENPQVPGIINGVAAGWAVSNGNAGTWNTTPGGGFFNTIPEGDQILFAGFGAPVDVSQTLVDTVQADTTYTLSFFLGQRLDMPLSVYSVSLEANGTTVLMSDTGGSTTPGNFVQRTITFDSGASPVTAGQTLGIFISATGFDPLGVPGQAEFDSFSLDASPTSGGSSVPEPATFLMIGTGMTAVMLNRRYFQKAK